MEKSYKQYLSQINTLIFDVDGVLTNGIVTVLSNGELIRQMNIKDGYALRTAVNAGLRVCIITGGKNEGVKIRLENLGIKDVYMGAHDKIEQYHELVDMYNLQSENVLYMGDDVPDYPVMKLVGLACCPNDAATEIQQIAKYISDKKGGEGCVRDIIEQILRVQGKWESNFDATFD
jgi:3-deoxy-D-manno-octulosonate 8-phosphate phosphatase (KDO 8-P phosphatase)